MGTKTPVAQSSELFRQRLCEMLNAKHPLMKLADVIDWDEIERSFGAHFQTTTGRPALSPPRGHPKFPRAAQLDYDVSGWMIKRAAASLSL